MINQEQIDQWSKLYDRHISEEYRQISDNLSSFLRYCTNEMKGNNAHQKSIRQ